MAIAIVSSGNCADFQFKQEGARMVVDVLWEQDPTEADIKELDEAVKLLLPANTQVAGSVYAKTEADVNRITKAFLKGGLN